MIFAAKDQRGFTLTEIIVVVGIVGIMAGLATASFKGGLTRSSLDAQKAMLFEALTRTRNMANSRDECAKLTVDRQLIHVTGYKLNSAGNCDPLGNETIKLEDFKIEAGYTVENFDNGSDSIVFNQFGGVPSPSMTKIYIHDAAGLRRGFTIYPALGQIRTQTP